MLHTHMYVDARMLGSNALPTLMFWDPYSSTWTPAALFQNGVISLIDCTLMEEPENAEEEGQCTSCLFLCMHTHTRTHMHTHTRIHQGWQEEQMIGPDSDAKRQENNSDQGRQLTIVCPQRGDLDRVNLFFPVNSPEFQGLACVVPCV